MTKIQKKSKNLKVYYKVSWINWAWSCIKFGKFHKVQINKNKSKKFKKKINNHKQDQQGN